MVEWASYGWSDLEPPLRRITAMIRALHLAGWSIGDVGEAEPDGSRSCLVYGTNGEHVIRAEAGTKALALRPATDQARSLGIPGRG